MTQSQAVDREAEIVGRLAQLSLEQKIRLMTGADIWALHPVPEIGLRRLVTSDGPAGVRGETWDERSPSANVPSPTALAASWDPARVERMGRLLASEARRKGVDVLLAPTVNLHRTPYGGRHFECFSEDPELTAMIGTAYVQGLQAEGVAATVKHFVANDSETDRFSYDALVDERVLRELYLAPFERIVAAGDSWAVMAAYNRVDGTTMTESALLREVLKREWAFDGVVMSDWYATRSVAAAGEDLTDLTMPGPESPWTEWLLDAVQSGQISESAINGHVLRLLRLAARVGALDGLDAAAPPARRWSDQELSAELRAAAAAGMVLIKNDGLLPLDMGSLKQIAVIGPNAATARTLGGGSATVFPPYVVSPLDGLRAALGNEITIVQAGGVRSSERTEVAPADVLQLPDGSGPGVEVIFFDADDRELGRQQRQAGSMMWWGSVQDGLTAPEIDHLTLNTRLQVAESGRYTVGTSGLGEFRLVIDGETLFDEAITLELGMDVVETIMKPPQQLAIVELQAGRPALVELTHGPEPGAALGAAEVTMLMVQLNVAPVIDEQAEFDHAVRLAADSGIAVVVVGTNEEVESEGFDRTSLALPGRQDDLVSAIAAVNPRTVVVVNSGAPVLLPWASEVAAILVAWFPGQEFGNALADVVSGAVEPGGRLPVTWPASEEGLPAVTPVNGELSYAEGLLIGYRWYLATERTPAFAFGGGLGYTTWAYQDLAANGDNVTITVRNTGSRAGREIVQLYASRAESRVQRAPRWLVGSAIVDAEPGEVATASITVGDHSFRHWDSSVHGWLTEPGTYQLRAGHSVADLPLSAEISRD
jgi:beta-glucosidase